MAIEMPRSEYERLKNLWQFRLPDGTPSMIKSETRLVMLSFSIHPGSVFGGNSGGVGICDLVVLEDEVYYKNSQPPLPGF